MALYLRSNDGTWNWSGAPNRVTTPSLCYYQNNAIAYLPLITKTGTLTINSKIWSYTTSIPTFHVIYNNTEYVVPNKYKENYDIAPGTYTPSAFKKLVTSFTGSTSGSYRTLANAVSVTVNGQTLSLSSGTKIYFVSIGSSPWHAQAIGFGVNYFQAASCQSGNGFSQYKAYIVLAQPTATVTSDICFNRVFATYEAYNITVSSPGIKFK